MKIYDKITRLISDCFFGRKCAVCNKPIALLTDYCPDCEVQLKRVPKELNEGWSRLSGVKILPKVKTYLDGYAAPFYYLLGSEALILNYKLKKRSELSHIISDEMFEVYKSVYSGISFDFICAVPMRKVDLRTKGFDHTEVLSEKLSEKCNIDYIPALKQIKDKLPQHELSAALRIKNVRNIYSVCDDVSVLNKTILLVDDICTTGSSINEAARTLKRAGAKKVYCLVVCVSAR